MSKKYKKRSSTKIIDFSTKHISTSESKNNFLSEHTFFLKDSVDLNYNELYLSNNIFMAYFEVCKVVLAVGSHFKGQSTEETLSNDYYLKCKDCMDGFTKALKRAYDVSYGDPEVKIGEIANPNYESDDNFSIIIPIDNDLIGILLTAAYNYRIPNCTGNREDFTNCVVKREHNDNIYLDKIHSYAHDTKYAFYQKMSSFCNIEPIAFIFQNRTFDKIKNKKFLNLEFRIF